MKSQPPVASVLCLAALIASGGCRFREPDPSEAVYRAAAAGTPVRPGITRGARQPEDGTPPGAAEAMAFAVRVGDAVVAFRPPGDFITSDAAHGVRGIVSGRCFVRPARVVFPCTPDEEAAIRRLAGRASLVPGDPAAVPLPDAEAATVFSGASQVADGAREAETRPDAPALCTSHDGGIAGVGPVVRQLTDLAESTRAPVDERAGVVVEALRPGTLRVCLMLSAPKAGAITLRGGPVRRLWVRGAYEGAFERARALGEGSARVFLYVDPEAASSASELVAAVEVPASP